MVITVEYAKPFRKAIRKLKDAALKERVKKKVAEITERPDIGKPLGNRLKGARSVYVPPFRITYILVGSNLTFLDFDNRDKIYR